MQERHSNRTRYFKEQAKTMEKHVIPYISEILPISPKTTILEIGCGEGGNMKPFLDIGCKVTGVDINPRKIKLAEEYYTDHPLKGNLDLLCADIYEVLRNRIVPHDVIIMRDVIEHIPDQSRFMGYVERFLKPSGVIFFGFPPWQMPFGGHQQMCKSKILSNLPYFHLLPPSLYKAILKGFGESENKVNSLMETASTGISIETFNDIIKTHNYKLRKQTFWLFNPHYEAKFNIKPKEQLDVISGIPYLRNFFTTCCYTVISK